MVSLMAWTNHFLLLAVVLISVSANSLAAQGAVTVSGEYAFGPDISQAEACWRAEERAKQAALQKVNGVVWFVYK